MSPLLISAIVVACVYGGAILGMALRRLVPEHHLSAESRDMMKVGTGLIGTTSALVLGLLVASAKEAYDAQKAEVTSIAARVAMLDRALAHYGPEAGEIRGLLRESVQHVIEQIWREDLSVGSADTKGEVLYDRLQDLAPQTDAQRVIKAAALDVAISIGQTRWTMFARRGSSVSTPLLVMVVFWLTVTFIAFGLLSPRNATVVVTLFFCALSVSGAIFLILELDRPFTGIIQISDAPLREVAASLGR